MKTADIEVFVTMKLSLASAIEMKDVLSKAPHLSIETSRFVNALDNTLTAVKGAIR
jgi:hypothetical protein